jgi:anti-anti-sigma regulatory factor
VQTAVYDHGQLVSEHDIDPELASGSVVTLHFYGSLFFASAHYFEEQLPHLTEQTSHAVVILNLWGQPDLDATTLDMLTEYVEELQAHDCRLMLADVGNAARATLEKTRTLDVAEWPADVIPRSGPTSSARAS